MSSASALAEDHLPPENGRSRLLLTAAACAAVGAVTAYAVAGLLALLAFLAAVAGPPQGEAIPAWAVWLWMAPAYLIMSVVVMIPVWTVLARSAGRPTAAVTVTGVVGGLLFGVSVGLGLVIGDSMSHTHIATALSGAVLAWAPVPTLTWSVGGLTAASLARRAGVGGEYRRGRTVVACGWLLVAPLVAAPLGALATRPDYSTRMACEEPHLAATLWRGEGQVTVRSGGDDPVSAHQVVWLDAATNEIRFEATPGEPTAVRTGRGAVVSGISRSVGVISPDRSRDRTSRCRGRAREVADDPWHLVALAARNHRPDTREERLGQWLEAAGGLLRKNSVSPDSVGPVIWTGLGGRVALTRDERSGLPISADIDTQTNSWRVDWTFDHIGAVPADGSRPVDMRAAADNTVANTEDHYWTLAEAQAFDAYPLYFVGGTFEGYDVQFVRRVRHYPEPTSARPDNSASGHTETSTTADPIADDRFCKPEDTVDVYYMPRFGETGAGRWLTAENAPRTDCVLSGFDRSKPIAIERSDATAFVSPHREPRVHIELPDAVVALSGTGWSAAELAVVAEGLVAVNSAASSDKATDLSTESDLERLQRATRGIVERTGPSSCSSSAREGQLQHGEPLDGW